MIVFSGGIGHSMEAPSALVSPFGVGQSGSARFYPPWLTSPDLARPPMLTRNPAPMMVFTTSPRAPNSSPSELCRRRGVTVTELSSWLVVSDRSQPSNMATWHRKRSAPPESRPWMALSRPNATLPMWSSPADVVAPEPAPNVVHCDVRHSVTNSASSLISSAVMALSSARH